MELLQFLALVLLMSSVFGRSSHRPWDIEPEPRMDGHSRALSKGSKPFVDKIVGGSVAKHGEIPWQVSVKNDGAHRCGAAILNEFWLLSAAHCFFPGTYGTITVTVGELSLTDPDPGEQTFEVESIYNHPLFESNYSEADNDYDFALIRINPRKDGKGFQFNKFVQPISLPAPGATLKDGDPILVSGWGATDFYGGNISTVLRKAVVPYVNQRTCKHRYEELLTDRMFCAGYKEGGIDACTNDSGGPAVYKSKDQYVLFGIVSWGEGCAEPDNYGVYARVTDVVKWIENVFIDVS